MSLFPLFLKLTGRPCLVIGAGNLAESKIESLLAANGRVTVIATAASPRVLELAAGGDITLHLRPYAPGDVHDVFLVVTATDDPAVNRAVYQEAVSKHVLCNAVDDPPFCDFYFPSVVRRGDLQIAISTAGASPALAQRLRKEINAALPLDTGDWLTDLGNLRREVVAAEPLNEARKLFLHQLAQREVCGFDQCPSRTLAREHARNNPLPHSPSASEPTS
ncbi:MAG: bifunctional precorrin-2 dehydrogenase/sirohydrochlorin ferrochelatase [Acidobacteriota bacterium]|nr:bifunctional precorrin-2 dehydrogenase/sirohydrochlorin ferrochelatase [Acidobacteriota bacterium]